MLKKAFSLILIFQVSLIGVSAKTNPLRDAINRIIKDKQASVRVSVLSLENGESISVNGKARSPMQSVYKFHLALAVLNQVDKGKFSLDQKVFIKKSDLLQDTWSPIRDEHPEGNFEMPLSEIIKYTVALSDNSGCDLLFRMIGGPQVADKYLRKIGIKDTSIISAEEEMQKTWDMQYKNFTTADASVKLLRKLNQKNILSRKSKDFLWRVMVETETGPNRLKGLLPKDAIIGHKTGTSGKNKEGMMAAVNDIGIIKLPNGKSFAIAVYVSDSKEKMEVNERIIAEISKAAYDYFASE